MSYACVILAAGEGRRAGGCKPLMELCGATVIDRVLAAAAAAASRILVVGGCRFEELRAYLEARHPAVEVVCNAAWEDGMFSSVQAGLAGIESPAFVHPADVPGVGPDVYRALAAAFEADPRPVVRPVFSGRRGHPVLLGSEAVAAVLEAPPGSSLRKVLASLPGRYVTVDDGMVLRDFDTAADLEALRADLGAWSRRGG
ncbi:MAG TPA: nucleotidyltransferase family protein [Polyangia bacterium]|nr:nucleotidyltransferase family protein [Polyangia bacterium]